MWASAVYGDASGGEHTQYNALRRCGVGLASVREDHELNFGLFCNLPGDIQTVSRGELFALVVLARFLVPMAECELITDNKGVHKTYVGGPASGANRTNCDLYEELFKLM